MDHAEINNEEMGRLLRFYDAIENFLSAVEGLDFGERNIEAIVKRMVILRKEVLKIRDESIIFYDFSNKRSDELYKMEFEEMKNIDEVKVETDNNKIQFEMQEKLEAVSEKKLLESEVYKFILFHLSEIYADYCHYKAVLDDIFTKRSSIHPDLLGTYLAGDFEMIKSHTLDSHIDDLVSFDKEFIFSKGLLRNISDFLEEYEGVLEKAS